jgi:hypothetical protein
VDVSSSALRRVTARLVSTAGNGRKHLTTPVCQYLTTAFAMDWKLSIQQYPLVIGFIPGFY